ncbi:MAG: hypothetical protein QW478_04140 [Candidatus Micrarchaeaceae archaeon]
MNIKLEVDGKVMLNTDIPSDVFYDYLFAIPYFFIDLETEDVKWITERVGVVQEKREGVVYSYLVIKDEDRTSDSN